MFFWCRNQLGCVGISFGLLFLLGVIPDSGGQTDWKREWDKTGETAKKEGEFVLYGPHLPFYQEVWKVFQHSYPGIKFNFEPGKGSDHLTRVLAERRAGIYRVDMVMGGGSVMHGFPLGTLDPISPLLILPEVTDPSAWWGKRVHVADKRGQYILSFSESVKTSTVAFNTNLVNSEEIRSWHDLLNPRWTGKIASFDPRAAGGGDPFLFFYYSPPLGPRFISRLLTEMDLILTRDLHQGVDWLARGKVELYLGSALFTLQGKQKGLPVDILSHSLKEGEVMGLGGVCCVVILNKAPHPNASQLFLNWLLSRQGQTAWQKFTGTNSLRTDIPKDDVHPAFVPREGVNYFYANSYQYAGAEAKKAMLKLVDGAVTKRK